MKKTFSFHTFFTKYGVILLTIISFVVFTFASPYFANMGNVNMMFVNRVAVGFFALATIPVMAVGEFDISLGYQIGLSIMLGAWIGRETNSSAAVVIFVLAMAALLGAVKAFIIVTLKVPATIATLGIGMVFYGGTFLVSNGSTIGNCVPDFLKQLFKTTILRINVSVWIFVFLVIVSWYLLESTPFGKHVYAIGVSRKVSYLAAIRTNMVRYLAFIISGLLIGVCGVILLSQSGQGYTTTGPGFMLPGMSLAFFGTTTHRNGDFNVPGMMLCWLLLSVVFNGISILGAPFWAENMIYAVIMIAVVLTTTRREGQNG